MPEQTPHEAIESIREHLQRQVLGQGRLVDRLLMALLSDGHLLVEGAPGLAKTRAVKALADAVEGEFHRIQFTPDLLPSDITGTDIYRPADGSFRFQRGPVFHNLVLADEINRAPAKVQSALLEAMAERHVSIGMRSYPLPELFMVMATQNPIEQEGTYPLPEAQLDRFLMHVRVGYPNVGAEREILRLVRREQMAAAPASAPVSQAALFAARREALGLHMAEAVETYIVQLVAATRSPDSPAAGYLDYGASPRGSIALDRCARARAWLRGRDYVSPEDVQAVAADALRHRLILSYAAEAEGKTADDVVGALLAQVPVG